MFPGRQVNRKQTINQERGRNRKISDRMDLTLECIRQHYRGIETNPLAGVLQRYAGFFALFKDFDGYVQFFLLQDLLEDDGESIAFFHPFKNFTTRAVPQDEDEYLEYLRHKNDFITARNARIDREP